MQKRKCIINKQTIPSFYGLCRIPYEISKELRVKVPLWFGQLVWYCLRWLKIFSLLVPFNLWREIKRYNFCLLTCCLIIFLKTLPSQIPRSAVSLLLRCSPWSPVRTSTWGVLLSPFSVCLSVTPLQVHLPDGLIFSILYLPVIRHICVKSSWALPQGVHLRIPMPKSSVGVAPLRRERRSAQGGGACCHSTLRSNLRLLSFEHSAMWRHLGASIRRERHIPEWQKKIAQDWLWYFNCAG